MKNKYYILRHGESIANRKKIISCWPEIIPSPLTNKGREQIKIVAEKLKNKKIYPVRNFEHGGKKQEENISNGIDLIFSSDVLRTKQTAEIVGKKLEVKPKYDKRLREYNVGIFNGRTGEDFRKFLPVGIKRFRVKPPKGETFVDIKKRMYDFLKDIDKKYSNKNILIVSHEAPLDLLEAKIKGVSNQLFFKKYPKGKRIKTGELRKL